MRLTDRGFEAAEVMRGEVAAVEGEFLRANGASDLDSLRILLRKLNEVLGTLGP